MEKDLWGIIIFKYDNEYYHHSLRAKDYESFKAHMAESGMEFKAGRNSLNNNEEIENYLLKAQRIVLSSMYEDNNLQKKLIEF